MTAPGITQRVFWLGAVVAFGYLLFAAITVIVIVAFLVSVWQGWRRR